MTQERIHLGSRVRVRAATAMDTTKLLNLAKERAPDPSVFDHYDPAFWQVKASSNRLDFYSTRMRPGRNKTLGNFKRGLDDGVSYLDSHNNRQNGLGQSLRGQVVRTDEIDPELGEPIQEVWGDFFTLRGTTINGHRTDDFLANIGAGVWRDVSVGFFASDIECGLCGKQVFDWSDPDGCRHFPGREYEDEDGNRVTAWAWINDGELSEVSQVYDGASPGAAVVKAEQMSAAGELTDSDRSFIERRFNTRILLPQRRWAVPMIGEGVTSMGKANEDKVIRTAEELEAAAEAEETEIEETAEVETEADAEEETVIEEAVDTEDTEERGTDQLAELRARFAPHGIRLGNDATKAVRALGDEVLRLRGKLTEAEGEAEIGRRYKADLIAATLAAGARAKGQRFKAETYKRILEGLDIDSIRAIGDDFGLEGDALFPGGRKTSETDATPPAALDTDDIDPEAFHA